MNPNRRQTLRLGLGLGLLAVNPALTLASESVVREEAARLVWRERLLTGFGTSLWLRAADPSADKVDAALDKAVQSLRAIEAQMNLFDLDSAISRLNRTGELKKPAPPLLEVLKLSADISAGSGGAFDVSMQPLWKVWTQAREEERLPTSAELARATRRVNWRAIDANAAQIRLPRHHAISLNGIAQGYAADILRAQLRTAGIRHAMLDTGETAVLGQAPNAAPWTFGIEDAHDAARSSQAPQITVPDGYAVATSSDAHTVFTEDRVHHHILDPRTGDSPSHWSSVTVMARSAALADGLTNVFFMLPPAQIVQAARRWEVSVVLQDKRGAWHRAG